MKRKTTSKLTSLLLLLLLFSCSPRELPEVSLDTRETGAPIEPYIYGQFIEHLGNCIYGGIWAEMVQDRKFYHPVEADFHPYDTASDAFWGTGPYEFLSASPWEIIGDADHVKMETAKPMPAIMPCGSMPREPGPKPASGNTGWVSSKERPRRPDHPPGQSSALPVLLRLRSGDRNITLPIETMDAEYRISTFEFESPFSSE
ncbi:MAG: hypothetical protein R2751_03870 [Bacteroidales bacterium]